MILSAIISTSIPNQLHILNSLYYTMKVKPVVISCIEMTSQRLNYANNYRVCAGQAFPQLILQSIDNTIRNAADSNKDVLVSMPLFDANSRKTLNNWIELFEDIVVIADYGVAIDFNEGFEIVRADDLINAKKMSNAM